MGTGTESAVDRHIAELRATILASEDGPPAEVVDPVLGLLGIALKTLDRLATAAEASVRLNRSHK